MVPLPVTVSVPSFRIGLPAKALATLMLSLIHISLTGAVNAAKDGETVTLLKDVDLGSGYVNIAKKLTLDLNGYTVTGSNTWVIGVYSDVTINDSSNGQGKICLLYTSRCV